MKTLLTVFLIIFCCVGCNCQAQNNSTISYIDLKKEMIDKKVEFRKEYELCKGNKEKQQEVVSKAREYLLNVSDSYFKAWYGTLWNFNGTSKTPQKGTIACGYFITTTLQDMGFNIPRVYWAQQTSEYMIKKVSSNIKRFHKAPMTDVESYIKSKGEGLYIVGLDCHVGYIYYWNGEMNFVHSNYYQPKIGVMSEPLIGRNPLNDSKYRVIGKIFDNKMIQNWILNIAYSQ